MLPPVLEIYVVWHPDDAAGAVAAEQIVDHFHGTAFSGLIGGAVEVYVRSEGWTSPLDGPRPLPLSEPLPYGIASPELTVVVPILGLGLAEAIESGEGPWFDYLQEIVGAEQRDAENVGIFPLHVSGAAVDGTRLSRLMGRYQAIGVPDQHLSEDIAELRCRDLAQGVAQLATASWTAPLTVFVSHTKRFATVGDEEAQLDSLVERIRHVIGHTRLREFFDASDLQPGRDWAAALDNSASTSALLAVRTDLYASREWCQREMLIAKRAGMPVVILDALYHGEERGSFLMDHVPRIASRFDDNLPDEASILRALNQLVDECLKRALWRRQERLVSTRTPDLVMWWAPHAPEPITLVAWLAAAIADGLLADDDVIRVLHPDPPLGAEEAAILSEIAELAGLRARLEVLTPRGLAARGG